MNKTSPGECRSFKKGDSSGVYSICWDEGLFRGYEAPYHFAGKQDYEYLLNNNDITVNNNGLIEWTGSELNTRFDDVRILAKNKCLFKVDTNFFLWHFPHDIFTLFDKVYILTYLFNGSIMKYYFDLYNLMYEIKSIKSIDGMYQLVDYYIPDKSNIKKRISVYEGKLNTNISQNLNVLSATWCRSTRNKNDLIQMKNNFYNFRRNIVKASGQKTMWTCYKDCKKVLSGKGYTNSFVACNCRATNEYQDRTCLMYGVNWYENPEIYKFFSQRGISIDQDMIALSTILQWIWRSNIRVKDSNEMIYIYIPSKRMRDILINWFPLNYFR